jgi:hypothetical protein
LSTHHTRHQILSPSLIDTLFYTASHT